MFGVASMLVVAAMLEAWVSPSTLPNPAKLTLGIANLFAVVAYFLFAGRPRKQISRRSRVTFFRPHASVMRSGKSQGA